MARLSLSLVSDLARGMADRVQDAVAERTAPPIVTAVRREGLTSLGSRALAELHEHVVEAEQLGTDGIVVVVGDGGAAVVAADARSSAREVCVFGIPEPDREALAAALTRHGFRPEATRVSLHTASPDTIDATVAVAYVDGQTDDLGGALSALATRISPDGAVLVRTPETSAQHDALTAAFPDAGFQTTHRSDLRILRQRA